MSDRTPVLSSKRSRTRERIARALVRWADRWWTASYNAYCRKEEGDVPEWWDRPWTAGARRVSAFAIPLACRIDPENAGEQMAQAGWWG